MTVAAFQPGRITTRKLDQVLSEEVESRSWATADRGVQGVLPNRDPVLTILAPAAGSSFRDERVYQGMVVNEHKIADARRHLESEIFADSFEILPGQAGDEDAEKFRRFAEALWLSIPHKRTVLRSLHDAYYYGWRPMQVLVDRRKTFESRPVWMPHRLVNKPLHMVRFTDHDSLAWLPDYGGQALEFPGPAMRLGWLTPVVGDLDHEYGEGLYRKAWLLYYTKRQIFRRFQQGIDRQMGLVKFSKKDESQIVDTIKEVQGELAEILEYLNANNILAEVGGWTMEIVTGIDFIGAGLQVIRYLNDELMTLFCGEILTSNPGDRGTQALGTVQRGVKTDYALDASEETVEGPITELFRTFVEANWGEQDPNVLPRFVSRARLVPNMESVRLLVELGASIRGRRLAELTGAGGVLARGDEDEDEVILKKQQAPPNPFLGGLGLGQEQRGADPPADDGESEDQEDDDVNDATNVQRQNARINTLLDAARRSAEPALIRRAHRLTADFAERNGLGDPS